jgi:hypothetical protein
VQVGQRITSPPHLLEETLFFGVQGGQVYALDLRRRELRLLRGGLKRVVAAPAYAEGVLYVGAHDHRLHALHPETGKDIWSQSFEHSLSAAPFPAEGLVAVCVNQAGVYLLEAETGDIVWHFPVKSAVNLLSDSLIHQGVIYAGTDQGEIYALPWHLGRYAWAGEWLARQGRHSEAAAYFAVAGDLELCESSTRQQCYWRAVELWRQAGEWEKAARFRESLLGEQAATIAVEFEEAGRALFRREPLRAADLLRRAEDWYDDAEDDESARRCGQMAAKVAHAPHLRLRKVNIPDEWEEGEPQSVVVELKNRGNAVARNIQVRFAGNLAVRIWMELTALNPGEVAEIETPLIAGSSGDLVTEAHYTGRRQRSWVSKKLFPIQVKPSTTVLDIDGDVGALLLDELEGKVKVRGNAGLVKITTRQSQDIPEFAWPEPPAGWEPEVHTLARVETAEEAFTVPAGHWSIFLADEAAVASVGPGRYDRKDFPQLRGRAFSHQPVWKAVVFSRAQFRLAYRLGAFSTQERVRVVVECGLTVSLDNTRPYEFWLNVMGEKDEMATDTLKRWLEPEVYGVLQRWISSRSEASLSAGFAHRAEMMLALEEELRASTQHSGVLLQDPLWALNFLIPGRERIDAIRESKYWERRENQANAQGGEGSDESNSLECPQCNRVNEPNAEFCDACGESLSITKG